MALPLLALFEAGSIGLDLYSFSKATGVQGWNQVAHALARVAAKMYVNAHKADAGALDEMVALAKSRVPVDTGRLLNGITGERFDSYSEFRASAVTPTGSGADYARFVEFGTAPGRRGVTNSIVADEGFYAADPFSTNPLRGRRTTRVRKSYRTHAGTKAQPFFYNSANEVLERRRLAMEDVIPKSAADAGWQLA